MSPAKVRALAFFLPQFHPIPENDEWWGPGFTEWTSVAQARPQYVRHYQPHIPRDLGFYDLRLAETRAAQAEAVRRAGLEGLCYYHYWFGGRRLLNIPIDAVLASKEPDLPFCFCWANESWTRAWDARSGEFLIRQVHSAEDDRRHIEWLLEIFQDTRYIRINDRPLFLIYRADLLPDSRRTVEIWREAAARAGEKDPFLCHVEGFVEEDPAVYGLDASVEFQPNWRKLPTQYRPRNLVGLSIAASARRGLQVYDYAEHVASARLSHEAPYRRFPCVMPSWDNTPRRGQRAGLFHGATPSRYESWLRTVVDLVAKRPAEEQLLFINAWNEWGEGAHLEPCLRWGTAYLDATARALGASRRS